MHPYLEREAQQLGLTNIKLLPGTAEDLPVEDESIDHVVSTHVLCSVTDFTVVSKKLNASSNQEVVLSLSNTLLKNVALGHGKFKMESILFGKICLITVI